MTRTLEEITKLGEEIYLKELKGNLEKEHMGEYVVIDVDTKHYFVDSDSLVALEKAKRNIQTKSSFL